MVALIACRDQPAVAPPVAPVAAPAIDAGVAVRRSFDVVPGAEREARARAIEARLPAAWQPKVRVDFAGYPAVVELALPDAITDRFGAVEQLLRDHAELFGIRGPLVKRIETPGQRHVYGAGRRWTGSIHVYLDGPRVTMSGHLWPIDTPVIPLAAGESVVSPYYGRHARYLSRCKGCSDRDVVLRAESFGLAPSIALVCEDGRVTPRPAIAIEKRYRGEIDGSPEPQIPDLVDATSLLPIEGFVPGDGATAETGPVFQGERGRAEGGCWDLSGGH